MFGRCVSVAPALTTTAPATTFVERPLWKSSVAPLPTVRLPIENAEEFVTVYGEEALGRTTASPEPGAAAGASPVEESVQLESSEKLPPP